MAPRLVMRRLRGVTRGASLAVCVGLAGAACADTMVGADFDSPTGRYGHAILGDAIEFGELVIAVEDWVHTTRYRVTLPQDHVFEDLTPRLWDITGDGLPEVVVI